MILAHCLSAVPGAVNQKINYCHLQFDMVIDLLHLNAACEVDIDSFIQLYFVSCISSGKK